MGEGCQEGNGKGRAGRLKSSLVQFGWVWSCGPRFEHAGATLSHGKTCCREVIRRWVSTNDERPDGTKNQCLCALFLRLKNGCQDLGEGQSL